MGSWHSPQKIYSISHRAVKDLLTVELQAQEKIDGSFFAFGLYTENEELVLKVRSKGAVMEPEAPESLFKSAVQTVIQKRDLLHPGWQYRGECVAKPRHNALSYDRVPVGNVILFDIVTEEETYLPYAELKAEGDRIGLEVVPQLFTGRINSPDDVRVLLQTVSVLGGQKIEGVVLKPLVPLFGIDGKLLMSKFVSEAFKEVHNSTWKQDNPTVGDIITEIGRMYGTPARWNKSVIHLRELGMIEDSPRDIGKVMRLVPDDVLSECEDEIKQRLLSYAWPHIKRKLTSGFPDFYKDQLLRLAFAREAEEAAQIPGLPELPELLELRELPELPGMPLDDDPSERGVNQGDGWYGEHHNPNGFDGFDADVSFEGGSCDFLSDSPHDLEREEVR